MGGETAAHTTGNFQRHLMDIKLLASQFRRGWSCHPALLARDTRVACSAVGLGQQLAAQRGPEVPPWWLGRVGGSSSSSKKEVSGIYRHRHTNTLQSSPPVLTTYLSSCEKRMFVT